MEDEREELLAAQAILERKEREAKNPSLWFDPDKPVFVDPRDYWGLQDPTSQKTIKDVLTTTNAPFKWGKDKQMVQLHPDEWRNESGERFTHVWGIGWIHVPKKEKPQPKLPGFEKIRQKKI